MNCDKCGKQATYFLTENNNGFITKKHLCAECAQKEEMIMAEKEFNIGSFLDSFSSSEHSKKVCEICGSTYDEILETGFVGCGHCYETFSEYLYPLISKIQGNVKHTGKMPTNKNHTEKEKLLIKLNFELDKAIAEKRFQDAARIDSQIRSLEGE